MVDILVSVCLIHGGEPTVPASVGVEVAGVHQPDGVAGVVNVEVEGDAPHDDQPEGQLQHLNNQNVMRERQRDDCELGQTCQDTVPQLPCKTEF